MTSPERLRHLGVIPGVELLITRFPDSAGARRASYLRLRTPRCVDLRLDHR